MDSQPSQDPEDAHQSTRPRLVGLDPRALMAEGLGPVARGAPGSTSADLVEIPGFEILRPLGSGGMGTVFLAKQKSLGREVAVKVLHPDQEYATQFMDRLEREARAMATLSHPNIVAVHDFVRLETGDAVIVMEAVEGGNLRALIRESDGPMPIEKAISLSRQIANGLGAAHEVGIVHRDVKPENILITRDGTAKVTDFGIALPLDEEATRLTVTGTTLGTVAYMAPEQLNGDPLDARADIYSLGVMLYEMLTGARPQGNFDPPQSVNSRIPKWAGDATLKALRTEPAERFRNVAELVEALESGSPGRRRWLATAGLAGLIGIGGAAYLMTRPEPPVNLLAGLDLESARVGDGAWTYAPEGLESDYGIAILQLRREPLPDSFEIEAEFTRVHGEYSVAFFFRTEAGIGALELDAWDSNISGIQLLSGADLNASRQFFDEAIENEKRYTVRLEVRPNQARVYLDGKLRQEVDLTGHALGVSYPWEWYDVQESPVSIAIGSFKSPTRFHRIDLRPR